MSGCGVGQVQGSRAEGNIVGQRGARGSSRVLCGAGLEDRELYREIVGLDWAAMHFPKTES